MTDTDALHVRLDVFDGPLDLLLSIIKEQQLDIATVPLASVAEQYLAYVRMMEDLDMEVAAEYLVIAATLVFLKSKALLPPIPQEFLDESEETAEEVEERLRRRLIAYSRYRELGVQLRARQEEASGYYFRDSGDPTSELVQHYRIDPEKLKVNGGSMSLGHPYGMTGARLAGHILIEGRRRGARYGVVTMCIGGGMGAAGLFEVVR